MQSPFSTWMHKTDGPLDSAACTQETKESYSYYHHHHHVPLLPQPQPGSWLLRLCKLSHKAAGVWVVRPLLGKKIKAHITKINSWELFCQLNSNLPNTTHTLIFTTSLLLGIADGLHHFLMLLYQYNLLTLPTLLAFLRWSWVLAYCEASCKEEITFLTREDEFEFRFFIHKTLKNEYNSCSYCIALFACLKVKLIVHWKVLPVQTQLKSGFASSLQELPDSCAKKVK